VPILGLIKNFYTEVENSKDAKHSKRHNYISVQDIDTILICMVRFSGSANSSMLSKISREPRELPWQPNLDKNKPLSVFWLLFVEFIREEIIAILGMVFVAFFNQVSMEVCCCHVLMIQLYLCFNKETKSFINDKHQFVIKSIGLEQPPAVVLSQDTYCSLVVDFVSSSADTAIFAYFLF